MTEIESKEIRSAPTPIISTDELEDGVVESKTPWPGTGPAPIPESLDWRWLVAAIAVALLTFVLAYLLDPPA